MILVTGGSEGIGYACALAALQRTSTPVLVTGRSGAKLEQARARTPAALRDRLRTVVSDQSLRSDVDALIARIRAADAIDGAVLGVGVNPMYQDGPCRLHKLGTTTIETTIATNCTHTVLLTTALLDRFRRQRRGALVWIGSQAAGIGLPGAALYAATKAFLSGLARAAAREYAGHGIRVHVAHPGLVRTPRTVGVADAFATRHDVCVADPDDVGAFIIELLLDGDASVAEVDVP
jgi:NAD(P)-dependent dehydrogenase (short-subunit alcohol dehydrogenase family)